MSSRTCAERSTVVSICCTLQVQVHLKSRVDWDRSMRRTQDLLTIGEIADRSGFATSAIRFYEDQGLVRSQRTAGNHRQFPRYTLRRLAFIRSAQRVGLS